MSAFPPLCEKQVSQQVLWSLALEDRGCLGGWCPSRRTLRRGWVNVSPSELGSSKSGSQSSFCPQPPPAAWSSPREAGRRDDWNSKAFPAFTFWTIAATIGALLLNWTKKGMPAWGPLPKQTVTVDGRCTS